MSEYLDLEDLLAIAPDAVGQREIVVRDYGLLEAAVARPRASAFGQDAYPDIHIKAAALLHSLVGNHALVDGNKRLAWLATFVFLDINGHRALAEQDDVVEFMVAVASGVLDNLEQIADQLRYWTSKE